MSGDILREHAAKSKPLALAVRAEKNNDTVAWYIFDRGKKLGRYNDTDCDGTSPTQSVFLFPTGIVGTAYAQPTRKTPDLVELLSALDSESSDQRVGGRIDLSKLTQPDQLKAIAERWDIKGSTYRRDLGLLTAWNTAISNDRAAAVTIAEAFSQSQVNYLAALTGHPDQTMRYGATRLMSWFLQATAWQSGIGPHRAQTILDSALAALRSPLDAAKVRPGTQFEPISMTINLLVALDGAACLATKADRLQVMDALYTNSNSKAPEQADSRVKELSTKLFERLEKCTGNNRELPPARLSTMAE